MTRWWKVATVLLVAGATASGMEWLGRGDGPVAQAAAQGKSRQAGDVPTRVLVPGTLHRVILARGPAEPADAVRIYCRIEGSAKILRVLADGTTVKKGDVVCILDSSALRDRLPRQATAIKDAEAAYQRARLAREDAEKALKHHKQSLAKAEPEVLEKDARDGTTRELESEVKLTRSSELAAQATCSLEKMKENKLKSEIELSTITAPRDGTIVHANDWSRVFGNNKSQIEPGATVRERQIIAFLYDRTGPMQINAKVPESEVAGVAPRMPVRVNVDAFPHVTMPGVVIQVAPLPDPANIFDPEIKVYTTHVRIAKPAVRILPGMTAQAQIDAGNLENVLSVPRGAVVHYQERDHVALKAADGRVEWRTVVLGATDGTDVEAREGLKAGEKVILDPRPLLTEDQRAILKAEREATAKKDAERQAMFGKAAELRKARNKAPAKQ